MSIMGRTKGKLYREVTNNKGRSRNILCTLLATILEDEEVTA
jgi:hypothetical protein